MALAHFGPVLDHLLERHQIVLGLAVEADKSEDRDLIAERFRIDVRVVAADEAGLFERTHAPQAWRCRDARPVRKINVGHAPVILQIAKDAPVDTVKFDTPHGG